MKSQRAKERWASKKVGVLQGGRSTERAISLESGAAMRTALLSRGYDAVAIDTAEDPSVALRTLGIDVAIVALHGRWGEDGCIQGLLETLGIPYASSGVLASALAMDKVMSKRLFAAAGLPTAGWVHPASEETALDLGLPLVLKPVAGGSSVGLTVVRDEETLRATLAGATQPLMAEGYVDGHELTVGVLGHGDEARALGTLEIRSAGGLYDYEAKYERDDTEYVVPAPFSEPIRARLADLAVDAHRLLGCCGATRVDFRWSDPARRISEPMLLEVNTLPGMTSHSLLPKMAAHAGLSYGDLVEWMLGDAALKA